MNNQTRLQALSSFLKAQRAKILPQSVGLAPGTRRRTPGLRREEVAQLAGVSSTWYTWLEQGRDIKVSPSVLDAVSKALQLTVDERKYLYALALESGTGIGTSLQKKNRRRSAPRWKEFCTSCAPVRRSSPTGDCTSSAGTTPRRTSFSTSSKFLLKSAT